MHTLIAGAGFSGSVIARQALDLGRVSATRRQAASLAELVEAGVEPLVMNDAQSPNEALLAALRHCTHLIVCIGPARTEPLNDPTLSVLSTVKDRQNIMPSLEWIGYLSTIGVYGDHSGNWVDENTPCLSTQMRSIMRLQAEQAWQDFAGLHNVPLSVLRLSGIYGPGRNAVNDAVQGRARMLIKPDQVFNRIHVLDLARATLLAARKHHNGVLNITDNKPAPPQDVVRFAHDLVQKDYPDEQHFDTADISEMARSFYSENKRVSNALSRQQLGMDYLYPDYKIGLSQLWQDLS